MPLPVIDNFAGSALSANWTDTSGVGTDFSVISGLVRSNRADHSVSAYWNADVFPNDQYAKALIGNITVGNDIAVAVRIQNGVGDAVNHGYGFGYDGATLYLYRMDGDGVYYNPPALILNQALNLNDELKITAVGSLITGWVNGVDTLNFIDTTYPSGSAGIMGYSASSTAIKSFEAGSLAVALELQMPLITSIASILAPELSTSNISTLDFDATIGITVNMAFNQFDQIILPVIVSTAVALPPTLSVVPNQELTMPVIISAAIAYPPTLSVVPNQELTMPVIVSTAVAYPPTLSVALNQQLTLPVINSPAQIFAPTFNNIIAQSIVFPTLVSSAVLYPPVLRTLPAGNFKYTTALNLLNRFGNTELALIAAPDESSVTGALLYDVLQESDLSGYNIEHVLMADAAVSRIHIAIASAERLIDSYISPRYTLPLEQLLIDQSSLTEFCNDIVRYKLMDDRTTDEVDKRYTEATRWLRDVSMGKASLGAQDTAVATPSGRMTTRTGTSKHDWGSY